MRNYIVLLLGSFSLLLATACTVPAVPQLRRPEPVDYFIQAPERHVHVADSCSDAPTPEQVRVSHVATPVEEVTAPRPRFYTRWRRVHGRWYRFTYRLGEKRAMVTADTAGHSRQTS